MNYLLGIYFWRQIWWVLGPVFILGFAGFVTLIVSGFTAGFVGWLHTVITWAVFLSLTFFLLRGFARHMRRSKEVRGGVAGFLADPIRGSGDLLTRGSSIETEDHRY